TDGNRVWLAPRLRGSPFLRPGFHVAAIPQPPTNVLGARDGEARLGGQLVDALLGHAKQLGDVDEAQRPGRPHVVPFKSQMPEGVEIHRSRTDTVSRGMPRCCSPSST